MEAAGLIAIILVCGLFGESILVRAKLKELRERITELEKSLSGR